MRRVPALLVCVLAALLSAKPAWGADFAIDLKVKTGKAAQIAHAHKAGIGSKPERRPVLEIKAGQRVHAQWQLRCSAAAQPVKDVLIHFFVVREKKTGQAALPRLDKTVTVESALSMDFKAGAKTDGELDFVLDKAGVYLVRLETRGAGAGSETYAALDVIVH
ncbi:MAG TPA: hypothetical protein VFA18_23025 [Gemmataceae bacterium]|nr:hypothetical protein [Gemmataceae bacterium]